MPSSEDGNMKKSKMFRKVVIKQGWSFIRDFITKYISLDFTQSSFSLVFYSDINLHRLIALFLLLQYYYNH